MAPRLTVLLETRHIDTRGSVEYGVLPADLVLQDPCLPSDQHEHIGEAVGVACQPAGAEVDGRRLLGTLARADHDYGLRPLRIEQALSEFDCLPFGPQGSRGLV